MDPHRRDSEIPATAPKPTPSRDTRGARLPIMRSLVESEYGRAIPDEEWEEMSGRVMEFFRILAEWHARDTSGTN